MERSFLIDNMAERVIRGGSTVFLHPHEVRNVCGILNKNKTKYNIYYPYKMAEKVIIYNEELPKVTLLEILTKNELKHSDILGSLFANQINPNQYGDILIINGKYYLIVLTSMIKYFITEFTKIGKWNIEVTDRDISIISDFEYEYEIIQLPVTSIRIDNVVSALTKKSRATVEYMFDEKEILLNYDTCKRFRQLNESDIISIRGHGKYKFTGVVSKNVKGKLKIEILKYK